METNVSFGMIFTQVSGLFLVLMLGYWMNRSRKLPKEAEGIMAQLTTKLFLPALQISVFAEQCTVENLKQYSRWMFWGVLFYLVSMLIAVLASRSMAKGKEYMECIYRYAFGFPNNGGFGIPLVLALFGREIPFESNSFKANGEAEESTSQEASMYLPRKDNYTVTELATFKLCPRMYYHVQIEENSCFSSRLQLHFYAEAVLYCDLLRRFMDYNLNNKMVYSDDDCNYIAIVEELHKACVEENKQFFGFLSNYELSDISKHAVGKLLSSIENSKQYIDGHTFTLIPYSNATYAGDGYTITVEHDNRFVDYEKKSWRMSQSTSYVEFLVMKTSDHKSELVHYKDMVEALDNNDSNEDRINLTSRILAKINIQFDSKRFAADGVRRVASLVDEVVQYDFAKAAAMPSSYCTYCRYNTVCLGK